MDDIWELNIQQGESHGTWFDLNQTFAQGLVGRPAPERHLYHTADPNPNPTLTLTEACLSHC